MSQNGEETYVHFYKFWELSVLQPNLVQRHLRLKVHNILSIQLLLNSCEI